MIDTSNAKWDFSKEEEYAIHWLNENGFDGTLDKQFVSKTIFTVTREGVTDKLEVAHGVKDMKIAPYMEQFKKNWGLLCELKKLRQEAQANG